MNKRQGNVINPLEYLKHLVPTRLKMSLLIVIRPLKKVIRYKMWKPSWIIGRYKLKKLLESGEVAIIPVGFRCYTKSDLKTKFGLSQKSLPFDSGFFPPESVANLINKAEVNLKFDDMESHSVCLKYENFVDEKLGLGIKFEKTTYEQIDSFAKDKIQLDINKYLDATFGYYTLDIKNNFVLSHFNWHKFASIEKSGGNVNPEENLRNINKMLNRRIKRLYEICNKAKYIFFIFGEYDNFRYMAIDDKYFDLNDLNPIRKAVKEKFKAKTFVVKSEELKMPHDLLNIINKS